MTDNHFLTTSYRNCKKSYNLLKLLILVKFNWYLKKPKPDNFWLTKSITVYKKINFKQCGNVIRLLCVKSLSNKFILFILYSRPFWVWWQQQTNCKIKMVGLYLRWAIIIVDPFMLYADPSLLVNHKNNSTLVSEIQQLKWWSY